MTYHLANVTPGRAPGIITTCGFRGDVSADGIKMTGEMEDSVAGRWPSGQTLNA
jgi:hypothetical protein